MLKNYNARMKVLSLQENMKYQVDHLRTDFRLLLLSKICMLWAKSLVRVFIMENER